MASDRRGGLIPPAGSVELAVLGHRVAQPQPPGAEHIGLEVTGLYWHFVDVVWILLYTVVYLL